MTNTDHKPFVVIGNANISPEELLELYGLTIEECHLGDERHMETYLTIGKVIRLYPRPLGDYEEHLNTLLQDVYDTTGGIDIKKARKKTKFKTDVPWYNALKKKGKG